VLGGEEEVLNAYIAGWFIVSNGVEDRIDCNIVLSVFIALLNTTYLRCYQ
jgi:hypothetical protein